MNEGKVRGVMSINSNPDVDYSKIQKKTNGSIPKGALLSREGTKM